MAEGQIIAPKADKSLGLLAYLALNTQQAYPRGELAALFYPEQDEKHAQQNLRQVLVRLRRMVI